MECPHNFGSQRCLSSAAGCSLQLMHQRLQHMGFSAFHLIPRTRHWVQHQETIRKEMVGWISAQTVIWTRNPLHPKPSVLATQGSDSLPVQACHTHQWSIGDLKFNWGSKWLDTKKGIKYLSLYRLQLISGYDVNQEIKLIKLGDGHSNIISLKQNI